MTADDVTLTEAEREALAAGWPDFWKVHAATTHSRTSVPPSPTLPPNNPTHQHIDSVHQEKPMWAVTRVANAAAVSRRRFASTCVIHAAGKCTATGAQPPVILFSEVSPVNVRALLKGWGYDVIQLGEIGSPEAGVAIAYLRDVFKAEEPTLTVGSEATSEGGGIRTRPILSVRLWAKDDSTGLFTAGHTPPPRAPQAAARYMRKFLRVGGLRGGDVNTEPEDMRKLKGRSQYRAIKVLGLLVPEWIKTRKAQPVNIGSDHPAVDVPVLLPKRPRMAVTRNPWRQSDA